MVSFMEPVGTVALTNSPWVKSRLMPQAISTGRKKDNISRRMRLPRLSGFFSSVFFTRAGMEATPFGSAFYALWALNTVPAPRPSSRS